MVLLNTKEFPECPAGCVIGLIYGNWKLSIGSRSLNLIVSLIQFMYINTNLGEFRLVYKLFLLCLINSE